jgi:4-hydroxy-tetrahydrodipicolinate reductase
MKTLRVLLIGAKGRMGKTIIDLAKRTAAVEIVAQCDFGDAIEPAMKNCDVVIDFSSAEAIEEICRVALEHRQPLVIGTTAHSPAQRGLIEEAAKSLPIVFASNFSLGVNALFWLTRRTAEILGSEFDLEIVEMHHRTKKDAPSGTAKTLAQILKEARKLDDQVAIQSIREGDVVGDHTVTFAGVGERLELTHRASSRETFAKGALNAAQWVIDKPPGLYSMQDVLGL